MNMPFGVLLIDAHGKGYTWLAASEEEKQAWLADLTAQRGTSVSAASPPAHPEHPSELGVLNSHSLQVVSSCHPSQ